jgi:hypothetical protein
VRFGKFQGLLKGRERAVSLTVNGQKVRARECVEQRQPNARPLKPAGDTGVLHLVARWFLIEHGQDQPKPIWREQTAERKEVSASVSF